MAGRVRMPRNESAAHPDGGHVAAPATAGNQAQVARAAEFERWSAETLTSASNARGRLHGWDDEAIDMVRTLFGSGTSATRRQVEAGLAAIEAALTGRAPELAALSGLDSDTRRTVALAQAIGLERPGRYAQMLQTIGSRPHRRGFIMMLSPDPQTEEDVRTTLSEFVRRPTPEEHVRLRVAHDRLRGLYAAMHAQHPTAFAKGSLSTLDAHLAPLIEYRTDRYYVDTGRGSSLLEDELPGGFYLHEVSDDPDRLLSRCVRKLLSTAPLPVPVNSADPHVSTDAYVDQVELYLDYLFGKVRPASP